MFIAVFLRVNNTGIVKLPAHGCGLNLSGNSLSLNNAYYGIYRLHQ